MDRNNKNHFMWMHNSKYHCRMAACCTYHRLIYFSLAVKQETHTHKSLPLHKKYWRIIWEKKSGEWAGRRKKVIIRRKKVIIRRTEVIIRRTKVIIRRTEGVKRTQQKDKRGYSKVEPKTRDCRQGKTSDIPVPLPSGARAQHASLDNKQSADKACGRVVLKRNQKKHTKKQKKNGKAL